MTAPLSVKLFEELATLDTPTVCNSLEEIDQKYRDRGFTTAPLVCPFPNLKPIVGLARTGMIRAMRPNAAIGADMRVSYYEYVSKGDLPRVTVLQDLDGPNAGYGAFWGEVNSNIHKALGSLGVVTDGCIRDIPDWAEGFQALAGSIKPSHAHVHMIGYGTQVTVAGMVVEHDDLIHADQHGAVVIPKALAHDVVAAAGRVGAKEKIILDLCKSDSFSFAKLKATLSGPKDIH